MTDSEEVLSSCPGWVLSLSSRDCHVHSWNQRSLMCRILRESALELGNWGTDCQWPLAHFEKQSTQIMGSCHQPPKDGRPNATITPTWNGKGEIPWFGVMAKKTGLMMTALLSKLKQQRTKHNVKWNFQCWWVHCHDLTNSWSQTSFSLRDQRCWKAQIESHNDCQQRSSTILSSRRQMLPLPLTLPDFKDIQTLCSRKMDIHLDHWQNTSSSLLCCQKRAPVLTKNQVLTQKPNTPINYPVAMIFPFFIDLLIESFTVRHPVTITAEPSMNEATMSVFVRKRFCLRASALAEKSKGSFWFFDRLECPSQVLHPHRCVGK